MSTPYYEDDLVTLYHGVCIDVLPSATKGMCRCGHDREQHAAFSDDPKCLHVYINGFGPERVCDCPAFALGAQIVVTSPPYNMGLVPGGNGRGMYRPGASNKAARFRDGYSDADDDALPPSKYNELRRAELALLWDAIPEHGAIFYNHRPRIIHGVLHDPLDGDYGLSLHQRIIWNRLTGIDVNMRAFCTRGEYILVFAKPNFLLASHAASGMGDVWDLGMAHDVDWHPAPFPLALPERCIRATDAQSVLDPFAGSGTTLLAATMAGIPSIGIERDEAFCERIARRLDQGVLDFGAAS